MICVGRPRSPLAEAIGLYESRIEHYFPFEAIEVKEASGRSVQPAAAMEEEGERLLARLPDHHELIVLHRPGRAWSSTRLADYFRDGDLAGRTGAAFVIGGAFGLARSVLDRADHQISLSSFTLPHELARLVLSEQIYRAGTILRNEPYHKGPLR